MAKARYLVVPSECFETFGRTAIEAFSQGTPVLAADLGAVKELVKEGVTGYRFAPGNVDALIAGALRFTSGEEYERMRKNCRNLFLNKYTAKINYTLLTDVYKRAIALRKMR
jgi:glycosyltransferase involved in cell wall biosynthesis